MKHILHAVLFFSSAATAFAQSVVIGSPSEWTNVQPGQDMIVQIVQHDSIERSYTLGIALGIQSCASAPCPSPTTQMGTVLYNGPFNPEQVGSQSYQNFTVTIPPAMPTGTAQLNVAYAALWGAGTKPGFDTVSENLDIIYEAANQWPLIL